MMMNGKTMMMAAALPVAALAWQPAANPHVKTLMMTEWGEKVTPGNAWRDAYPRPNLVRDGWTNLNGLWQYAVVKAANHQDERPTKWDGEILVPFALETPLSGVGRLLQCDELLWYRRTLVAPKLAPGRRLLLHFGAVDLRCQVFIGHDEVTDVPHEMGNVPFTLDVTDYVRPGENDLRVLVWDPTDGLYGAPGKQVPKPGGCMYTRMSGIWQTVWTEVVNETHLAGYKTACDVAAGTVDVTLDVRGDLRGVKATVEALADGKVVARGEVADFRRPVTLKIPDAKLWTPETPDLYDLRITVADARGVKDVSRGYFALREVKVAKDAAGTLRFFLNGTPRFLLGPLDQGWWPDGHLTPPSDAAIEFEINYLKELGFNMLRKHIKIEPLRYYWHCDRLGLMVLQDMPSGFGDLLGRYGQYRRELDAMVDLLQTFPSIIGWVPYNEGWGQPGPFLTHTTLDFVRRKDPTRLVNGPSGWFDWEGGRAQGWKDKVKDPSRHLPEGECEAADFVDKHDYSAAPGMFAVNPRRMSFLGEFGGIGYKVPGHLWSTNGWGYIQEESVAAIEKRYLRLMDHVAALAVQGLGGAVYTQTTDVEIEANGYLTYDRKVRKMDTARLRAAHGNIHRLAELGTKPSRAVELFPRQSANWAYTFTEPATGWACADFDDAAWARGRAGFGCSQITNDHKTAVCNVAWEGKQLWLRREFECGDLGEITLAMMDVFHDEDATIYLNGVEMLALKGFTTDYRPAFVAGGRLASALKRGRNVLAVKVVDTCGSRYFDCSLSLRLAGAAK